MCTVHLIYNYSLYFVESEIMIPLLLTSLLIFSLLQASDVEFTEVKFALIIDGSLEDTVVLNAVKRTVEVINENDSLLLNLSLSYSVLLTEVC